MFDYLKVWETRKTIEFLYSFKFFYFVLVINLIFLAKILDNV